MKLLVPDLPKGEALLPYLRRIDESAWYTNHGPLSREFEQRCARMLGGERSVHCVTAASGTAALELALRAVALTSGSRVLVPAFTFPATIIAVLRAELVPVLADVDAARWVLEPGVAAEAARRLGCHAIVPVAAFGVALDLDAWDAVANEHGLVVVIDGAGALGAMPAARQATIAFSLHATKPLGIGEGGLIATPHEAVAERARRLANYGFVGGRIDEAGTNGKLSEYAAAVALAQLDRAQDLLARRRGLWSLLRQRLESLPALGLQRHFGREAPANLVVRVPGDARRWKDRLSSEGIETRQWYCPPLHRHDAFATVPRADGLDESDRLGRQALGLPFHTRLTTTDVDRLMSSLVAALASADLREG
jgi:dTDP-4-amino-4,6-dideoxygalactose transaminase